MSAVATRINKLEDALGIGGGGWDDDLLRQECRRIAIEEGLDEDELVVESVRVLEFARDNGLQLGTWPFVEAWAKKNNEDPITYAAFLESKRRDRVEDN